MNVLQFSKSVPLRVWAKQGDTGRTEEFQLVDNGVPIDLTGCVVTFNMKKPAVIYASAAIIDAEAGKVKVALTSNILSQKGTFEADISIVKSDESIISSATFILEVEATQRDIEAIEATDDFSALQEALTAINSSWEASY